MYRFYLHIHFAYGYGLRIRLIEFVNHLVQLIRKKDFTKYQIHKTSLLFFLKIFLRTTPLALSLFIHRFIKCCYQGQNSKN